MAAPTNVRDFAQLLLQSKLLSADEIKSLTSHLQSQSLSDDVEGFRKLLIGNKYLTEYQAALLMRGHSEGFFLNEFKILDLLGKGRMAGVYKAIHKSGQVVAVKVLPASKAKDPETLARFRREARLLTKLDHPNVVRAFQVGESDGKNYFAMEYLEGDTLEEILEKRKKLPPLEAVRVIQQSMLGLQHLYEKGMIHRDLKPANIMLVETGTSRRDADTIDRAIKLLDIGLGKSVFEEGVKSHVDDPSQLTNDGVLIGTPDYLAPEQARKASSADIRSDIYSLGCVLYHTLTGQPPFPDKSLLNTVLRHSNEQPRPLSDFLERVPDGLQNVMNWLMAKDPAQRYATPDKAAQALQLFLRNTPESPRAAAPLPAFEKWLKDAGTAESRPAAPVVAPTVVPAATAVVPPPVATAIPVGRPEVRRPAATTMPGTMPPQVMQAAPALPAAKVEPNSASSADVELISIDVPEREEPREFTDFDRRDVLMMCTGGGLVAVAIGMGYGLSRLLKRSPVEQKPEPKVDPEPDAKEGS
jgi:eukaryotic-like serine/threonine-protein kinase